MTSSSITVQWGVVPCIDRNGQITGYSVRYGEMGSGSTQTMSASGDFSGGMYVISDLESSTTYSIEVAAVNDELIGPYSDALNKLTAGTLALIYYASPMTNSFVSYHSCSSRVVSWCHDSHLHLPLLD